jgi:hypothetical protein
MALYPNSLAEHGPCRSEVQARRDAALTRFPQGCFVKTPDLRRFHVIGHSDDGEFLIVNEVAWGGTLQLRVEDATRYVPKAPKYPGHVVRLTEEEDAAVPSAILFDEAAE